MDVEGGSYQKASRLIAARVTEYIGYLEKGQIPPKVRASPPKLRSQDMMHLFNQKVFLFDFVLMILICVTEYLAC